MSTDEILKTLDRTPELVSDDLFLAAMPFALSIDEKFFHEQLFESYPKSQFEMNIMTGTVKNEGEVWMRTVDPGPMSGQGQDFFDKKNSKPFKKISLTKIFFNRSHENSNQNLRALYIRFSMN